MNFGRLVVIFLATEIFLLKGVWAGCDSEAKLRRDQIEFSEDLRRLKKRVSGFAEFEALNKKLEDHRLAGIEAYKRGKEELEQERLKVAQDFSRQRAWNLRRRRLRTETAWRRWESKQMAQQVAMECSREAYVRARDEFMPTIDRVRMATEDRELDAKAR